MIVSYKGKLQEYCQQQKFPLPRYDTNAAPPPFVSEVTLRLPVVSTPSSSNTTAETTTAALGTNGDDVTTVTFVSEPMGSKKKAEEAVAEIALRAIEAGEFPIPTQREDVSTVAALGIKTAMCVDAGDEQGVSVPIESKRTNKDVDHSPLSPTNTTTNKKGKIANDDEYVTVDIVVVPTFMAKGPIKIPPQRHTTPDIAGITVDNSMEAEQETSSSSSSSSYRLHLYGIRASCADDITQSVVTSCFGCTEYLKALNRIGFALSDALPDEVHFYEAIASSSLSFIDIAITDESSFAHSAQPPFSTCIFHT